VTYRNGNYGSVWSQQCERFLFISGFLDFVNCLEFWILENTAFRKLDLFPSSGEGRETPTPLCPLERTDLITEQQVSKSLHDWRPVSQSVSMFWRRAHYGTFDQILLPVGMLLSESWGLVSVGRPLWRKDGSAICSAITQWSETRVVVDVEVTLQLTVSQSVSQCVKVSSPLWDSGNLCSKNCGEACTEWKFNTNVWDNIFLKSNHQTKSLTPMCKNNTGNNDTN
jgi:hypothetical protein